MNRYFKLFSIINLFLYHLDVTNGLKLNGATSFSSLSYDDIHKYAISDQIFNSLTPQKSLNTRQVLNLDGVYEFCLDEANIGFEENWHSSSLNAKCKSENYYKMPVPSAFNEITSNATVKNYVGWFWYQTIVSIHETSIWLGENGNGSRFYVQFEGANYMALVWLQQVSEGNSRKAQLLGSHVGGYLPFLLDASGVIDLDTTTNYRLTVAVSNKLTRDTIPSGSMQNLTDLVGRPYEKFQPDFDFFHFAGLMGSVNLLILPKQHIAQIDYLGNQNIFIPEDINHTILNFKVCLRQAPAKLSSSVDEHSSLNLSCSVMSTKGKKYKIASHEIEWQDSCSENRIDIKSRLKTWTPVDGNPNHFVEMLKVKFYLESNGKLIDSVELRVAPRPDANERELHLNKWDSSLMRSEKKKFNLRGFGTHHEQLFSGRTMSLAAIMKDIYLFKQMGANLVRTSHYPYSSDYLDACDLNGISVIAECQAVGLNSFSETKLKLHKQLLLEMMRRDSHHPSIIMWSVANEPQSQQPESRAYFKSLLEFARSNLSLYTTSADRPLTAAIAQAHDVDRIGDLLDVIMVNRYYGWYEYMGVIEAINKSLSDSLLGWAKKYPAKPLILSEFGAEALAGLHSSSDVLFSEEYQSKLLVEYERVLDWIRRDNSSEINLWGSMIWNFADFSTHNSLSRVGGNRKGVFTREREPKTSAANIKMIYTKTSGEL